MIGEFSIEIPDGETGTTLKISAGINHVIRAQIENVRFARNNYRADLADHGIEHVFSKSSALHLGCNIQILKNLLGAPGSMRRDRRASVPPLSGLRFLLPEAFAVPVAGEPGQRSDIEVSLYESIHSFLEGFDHHFRFVRVEYKLQLRAIRRDRRNDNARLDFHVARRRYARLCAVRKSLEYIRDSIPVKSFGGEHR